MQIETIKLRRNTGRNIYFQEAANRIIREEAILLQKGHHPDFTTCDLADAVLANPDKEMRKCSMCKKIGEKKHFASKYACKKCKPLMNKCNVVRDAARHIVQNTGCDLFTALRLASEARR